MYRMVAQVRYYLSDSCTWPEMITPKKLTLACDLAGIIGLRYYRNWTSDKAYDQSKAVLLPSHSVSGQQSFIWVFYIVPCTINSLPETLVLANTLLCAGVSQWLVIPESEASRRRQ